MDTIMSNGAESTHIESTGAKAARDTESPPRRRRGTMGNLVINSTGTLVQTAIALVTVPLFIHHIGSARFGVLSLVWILLGYFGFLDLGLSRASANALGKLRYASRTERAGVLTTSFYLNLSLGVGGSLLIYAFGELLLDRTMHLSGSFRTEVLAAFPWIVLMLPIGMSTGIFTGALESREHFVAANLLQIIGYVLGQALPLVCVILIGPALSVVIPATLCGRAVTLALTIATVGVLEGGFELRRFDRARSRELFRYGSWVTVTNLMSPILEAADRLMIGSLLGAAAVSYYSVPMSLASRAQFIPGALSRTLFPRLSALDGAGAANLAARATSVTAYVFACVCAPAIPLVGAFLALWVDADFASRSTATAEILLVGVWLNGVAFIPFSLLQGQGRPAAAAKLHALELVPFLGFLYLMTEHFGLVGAACAWTARVGLDGIGMLALTRGGAAGFLRLAPPLLVLTLAYSLTALLHPGLLAALLVAVGLVMANSGLALALEPDIWAIGSRAMARVAPLVSRRRRNR